MAVLGVGGKLLLKRKAPEACVLSGAGLNWDSNTYPTICPGYWNGDHINAECLPVVTPGELAGDPDYWANYRGGTYYLGPNRTHIATDTDGFYKKGTESYPDGQQQDASQFYARVGDVSDGDLISGCKGSDYWIHIDELGKVSFYTSRCAALAGCPDDRVDLAAVGNDIVVAPYGHGEYLNAVWQCFDGLHSDYQFSDVADAITLVSICADAPTYQKPEANPNDETNAYDNANVLPRSERQVDPYWECVADLREWSLDLSAPEVDTTSVAEKFGTAVKSLVSGGGTTEFFIDRKCFSDGTTNGLTLMQLLLMTEQGCEASARFYMVQRDEDCGVDPCNGLVSGDLFYESEVLVTQTAVNMRPTELVVGTANFVTTGAIRLQEAP